MQFAATELPDFFRLGMSRGEGPSSVDSLTATDDFIFFSFFCPGHLIDLQEMERVEAWTVYSWIMIYLNTNGTDISHVNSSKNYTFFPS